MLENLYGTFTFGLIITSIAILVGFVIFQYIFSPILKFILTPIIGGAIVIGEFFGKAFEKKEKINEEKNSMSENPDSFANKFANNYLSITSIFVVLPFISILILTPLSNSVFLAFLFAIVFWISFGV